MALEVSGTASPQPRARPADPSSVPRATVLGSRHGERATASDDSIGPVTGRRTVVQRFDLWTVLKVSLCFYLCALAVTIVAGIALWFIASAAGVVKNSERFMGDLLSADDFQFLSASILEGAALIGLALVILAVILTLLAAAFYNLFAQLVGGVEIIVTDES